MTAKSDVKKLKAAFKNEEVPEEELSEVICKRTNTQLQEIQEVFAKKEKDKTRSEHNQPLALTKFIENKLEKAKTVRDRKDINKFLKRVLTDPYLRSNPAEREDKLDVDEEKASQDALKLPGEFLEVFIPEGGSMEFGQVWATVEKCGGLKKVTRDIRDKFASPFQDLCVSYLEFVGSQLGKTVQR